MDAFPLFMTVKDRPVVIFGSGEEAAAKWRLVAKTTARLIIVADRARPRAFKYASAEWVLADPLKFELPGNTAFAYAATGDHVLDARIADNVRKAGVTVCAADQPAVSDFSTPAIVDRDPVVVAIGTEGSAPVLARMIKARVEAILPASIGAAANIARSLRNRIADMVEPGLPRRRFWQGFFAKPFSGASLDEAALRAHANALISNEHETPALVSLVEPNTDDPEMLTLRARKRLDAADIIFHDDDVAPAILELARREAIFVPLHDRNAKNAVELIENQINAHRAIVRIYGGSLSSIRAATDWQGLTTRLSGNVEIEHVPGVGRSPIEATQTTREAA
ncbi:MAG: NAD(P)-dependent oxidoreductase [Pseudomonadota bacterium]